MSTDKLWWIKHWTEVHPPDCSVCQECGDVIFGDTYVHFIELDYDSMLSTFSEEDPTGTWTICGQCQQRQDDHNRKEDERVKREIKKRQSHDHHRPNE